MGNKESDDGTMDATDFCGGKDLVGQIVHELGGRPGTRLEAQQKCIFSVANSNSTTCHCRSSCMSLGLTQPGKARKA